MQVCTTCKYILVVIDEGLRARKQRETREAIHRAAVRNALLTSPDAVTIASISAEANVSTRTFFNYFPCKEDAMLGFHRELLTDEALEVFAHSTDPDLLRDTVHFIQNVFSATPIDRGIVQRRRELIQQHPQLLQQQMTRLFAVETRIASVLAERMRELPNCSTISDIDAGSRILVMLATNTVRNAIRATVDAAEDSPSSTADDHAIEDSLTTLREVISTLS